MAAKMAQNAVLYFTIFVRVLLALLVLVSVISCSIRISPFTVYPAANAPGEILTSYRDAELKKGFWEETGLCDRLMS